MRYAPSSLFEFPALPQGYRWHMTPEPEQYGYHTVQVVHGETVIAAERVCASAATFARQSIELLLEYARVHQRQALDAERMRL